MSAVEGLVRAYERFVRLPWDGSLAGPQRVWFAVYDPAQERRLRWRIEEFAAATRNAGHGWRLVDLTDAFARWMAGHEYREAYFEQPEDIRSPNVIPTSAANVTDSTEIRSDRRAPNISRLTTSRPS